MLNLSSIVNSQQRARRSSSQLLKKRISRLIRLRISMLQLIF